MWLDPWLGGQTLTPEIFHLLEDFEKGKEACGTSVEIPEIPCVDVDLLLQIEQDPERFSAMTFHV